MEAGISFFVAFQDKPCGTDLHRAQMIQLFEVFAYWRPDAADAAQNGIDPFAHD